MVADRSDLFARLCREHGGKTLVIELARGVHVVQPMATFHIAGGIEHTLEVADTYSSAYCEAGFSIVRRKIEFDLYAARRQSLDALYVEWHGRIEVGTDRLGNLRLLCEQSGAHLSRNAMSRTHRRFITVREANEAGLQARVGVLQACLAADGWVIERERWEGVAFDSNLALDQGWL